MFVVIGQVSGQNFNAPAMPSQVTNGTSNNIASNLANPKNSTNGSPFDWISQSFQIIQQNTYAWVAWQYASGGFILSVLSNSLFHFPTIFVTEIQVIVFLLQAAFIAYIVTGRFGGALTSD